MTFYRSDQEMTSILRSLLIKLEKQGRPNLRQKIAITWICYENQNPLAGSGRGANWSNEKLFYPASIVKIFYAVAIEAWLQKDLLVESLELNRALRDMIKDSSNDATSLIVDLLTGTTSGPSLHGERWEAWQQQRGVINQWLQNLKWPEFAKINCSQKTWGDGPYGREKDFYRKNNMNRNALTTDATARLLEEIMTNNIISPLATKRLQNLLSRKLDINARKKDNQNQVDGFLGEGLSQNSNLWSKAGWMSEARHDAAWWTSTGRKTMLLVVFSHGEEMANDTFLLPSISEELNKSDIGKKEI